MVLSNLSFFPTIGSKEDYLIKVVNILVIFNISREVVNKKVNYNFMIENRGVNLGVAFLLKRVEERQEKVNNENIDIID